MSINDAQRAARQRANETVAAELRVPVNRLTRALAILCDSTTQTERDVAFASAWSAAQRLEAIVDQLDADNYRSRYGAGY